MKVARRHNPIRCDWFKASDKCCEVSVMAHSNSVCVRVVIDGKEFEEWMPLPRFAEMLALKTYQLLK